MSLSWWSKSNDTNCAKKDYVEIAENWHLGTPTPVHSNELILKSSKMIDQWLEVEWIQIENPLEKQFSCQSKQASVPFKVKSLLRNRTWWRRHSQSVWNINDFLCNHHYDRSFCSNFRQMIIFSHRNVCMQHSTVQSCRLYVTCVAQGTITPTWVIFFPAEFWKK